MSRKKFLKNIEAKVKVSTVVVMMIVVALSTIFVLMPDTIVKADAGTVITKCDLPVIAQRTYGAWDPTRGVAYLFGGYQTANVLVRDKIVKFDPVANTTVNVSVSGDAMYPVNMHHAVRDPVNDCFYILGGYDGSNFLNNISRFWPSNNTFNKNIATLPANIDSAGCCWDSDRGVVILIGGRRDSSRRTTGITEYNPANNTAWTTGDTIQTGFECVACAWNNASKTAYLFGGDTAADEYWDGIQAYCPGNHTSWTLSATLPVGLYNPCTFASWDSTDNLSFFAGGIIAYQTYTDDIVEYNYTSNSCRVVNNITTACYVSAAVWDNTNRTYYVFGGYATGGDIDTIWKFNLTVSAADASIFTIKGLSSGLVTWSGEVDTTVWCNSSGTGNEWLEANMSINATDNITELRVFMADLDNAGEYINASNITMYVSSDNSSYGEVGSFADGGGNCTTYINSTNWNAGTMGADPFAGAGLTDKTTSIYLIFKLTIPATVSAQTYTSATTSTYKVWFCTTT